MPANVSVALEGFQDILDRKAQDDSASNFRLARVQDAGQYLESQVLEPFHEGQRRLKILQRLHEANCLVRSLLQICTNIRKLRTLMENPQVNRETTSIILRELSSVRLTEFETMRCLPGFEAELEFFDVTYTRIKKMAMQDFMKGFEAQDEKLLRESLVFWQNLEAMEEIQEFVGYTIEDTLESLEKDARRSFGATRIHEEFQQLADAAGPLVERVLFLEDISGLPLAAQLYQTLAHVIDEKIELYLTVVRLNSVEAADSQEILASLITAVELVSPFTMDCQWTPAKLQDLS